MQPEEMSPDALYESDLTAQFCARLQPLPSPLRYYDEFEDSTRSIREPHQARLFEIHVYGSIRKIDFNKRNQYSALILKHVFAMMLEQDLSPASIAINFAMMHDFTDDDLDSLLRTGPLEIGLLWSSWRSREWQKSTYVLVKQVLHFEADGFHASPYGHCLNSFTVDPCPKHLECFANCRHLSATTCRKTVKI
ncbi:hypothetical protein [Pseudoduganella namucuonensis]|uniref:hypothetical protein n=1 Tax=Pseudoduganella namucuonensis TaxID=1035707 RepID=UPI001E47D49D|nr:hypothetical protein [Pseudoduganella namucuonensis]